MPSAAFPSGDSRGPSSADALPAAPPEQAAEPTLMERVLRETLAAAEQDAAFNPADVAALREVVRQHSGIPISLEPVAIDLVLALLTTHFRSTARPPEFWQALAKRIATTLWDDPPSQTRLQRLWSRLSEVPQ